MSKIKSLYISQRGAINIMARIKWLGFSFLEWLIDFRGRTNVIDDRCLEKNSGQAALWVFVSTIGELNAISQFLKRLIDYLPRLKLVLITDHGSYADSYKNIFPMSFVQIGCGDSQSARKLGTVFPPELLVIGEIPCRPSDAPCRFSFSFLMEAKSYGAITCIVNAWLYHYQPVCRMDFLERKLFQVEYLRFFDLIATQNDDVRANLIEYGANPAKVHVVGNLKFDALTQAAQVRQGSKSSKIIASLIESKRPVIVAGCITNLDDQHFVLDAFLDIRLVYPNALLVIAPRHPEVNQRMQLLEGFLQQRAIPSVFRSRIADEAISPEVACVVLDTMGELRDFYALAHVAHVGTNHNVLEPLGYGKPVTVQTGWNETFPSYSVYRLLLDHGGLMQVYSPQELGSVWKKLLESPDQYRSAQANIKQVLDTVSGSLDRLWRLVEPLLPPVYRSEPKT